MLDFDPEGIRGQLAGLDEWSIATFSAACVEFLIPSYRRFSEAEGVGDSDAVEAQLDSVWRALVNDSLNSLGLELPRSEAVMHYVPDQDEEWNDWSACAENAVTALALLLDYCATRELDLAVRIANQAYEAVDWIASSEMDVPIMDSRSARGIRESNVVQVELKRQQDSLYSLREGGFSKTSMAQRLREISQESALGRLA
ncbi:DUF416 family protein [Streptomyces mirabilis]|uniref:DUF416 family protein n=1 Tax=Streptomyces mirabilis TaxID=68239 RepID=UPI00225ACB62|nr:DUF416 family protein [Streptomyces mirabilis]MCX4423623.1 YjaG family protein [Streptomyces mirabilis]